MHLSTLTQQEIEQVAGAAAPVPTIPPYNPFGPGGEFEKNNRPV